MGCTSSKRVVRSSDSPSYHSNSTRKNHDRVHNHHSTNTLTKIERGLNDDKISEEEENRVVIDDRDCEVSNCDSVNLNIGRLTEAEHVAAGWPTWLTAVAGEAIDGWLPLKSDSFERLGKIGQGTYSSVYRARHTESGRIVALKKVRFDNLRPDSVKFMAREITILRTLDHPNIMKLEGIITSRLSCTLYFVFEYMEHDLAGLLSCPDIKFSDSQVL